MTTPLRNERGAVLLLTLLVVALLSAILVDWAFSTLVELRLTETFRDGHRAYHLARGGVEVGRQLLAEDRNGYDAADEAWSLGIPAYPVEEDAVVAITLRDRDGLFNLNRLVDATGENPDPVRKARLKRLLDTLGIARSDDLVAALVDWIDRNETTGPGGAESTWYRTLQPPRAARNAPLDTVDELLLVKGFDADVVKRLAPFVTVFGSGRLNINTAPREVLACWDAEVDAATLDLLLERRRNEPFRTLAEARETLGIDRYSALNRNLDLAVRSDFYGIAAEARVGAGVRSVAVEIDKRGNRLLQQQVY